MRKSVILNMCSIPIKKKFYETDWLNPGDVGPQINLQVTLQTVKTDSLK